MSSPEELIQKGIVLQEAEDEERALIHFDRALDLSPHSPEAHYHKGLTLSQMCNKEGAIESFSRAISLDLGHIESYRNKGVCLLELGKYEEAVTCLDKAIELSPTYARPFNNKGNALLGLGKIEESIEWYDKAIELNPNLDMAYVNKGCALYKLGKYREALEVYKISLKICPNDADVLYNAGNSCYCMGDFQEALHYYIKSLDLDPENVIVLCSKGAVLNEIDRDIEALEDFKKAYQLIDDGNIEDDLPTDDINSAKSVLIAVEELVNVALKVKEIIQKDENTGLITQKYVENFVKLQEYKKTIVKNATYEITKIDSIENHKNELNKLKIEFEKLLINYSEKIKVLPEKSANDDTEIDVSMNKLDNILSEFHNQIQNFKRTIEIELLKTGLSQADRDHLKEYCQGFIETFSCISVISQVIDRDYTLLGNKNLQAKALSVLISFASSLEDVLSTNANSLKDALQSKQMRKNLRKMESLASNEIELSQIIENASYKIVVDEKKQLQILQIIEEDLDKVLRSGVDKFLLLCSKFEDNTDQSLHYELYKTPAARLGSKDANSFLDKWIKGQVDPYNDVTEELVKTTIEQSITKGSKSTTSSTEDDSGFIGSAVQRKCCTAF